MYSKNLSVNICENIFLENLSQNRNVETICVSVLVTQLRIMYQYVLLIDQMIKKYINQH